MNPIVTDRRGEASEISGSAVDWQAQVGCEKKEKNGTDAKSAVQGSEGSRKLRAAR